MSKVFNMVGGGGQNISSIIITGLESTDTITCTKDGKSYTATWDSTAQHWEIVGLPLGTFTVTATNGTKTKTETVLIDIAGVYEIEMTFKLWLYKDGDEFVDVTGGWVDDTPNNGWTAVSHRKNKGNLELSKGGLTSSTPECCVFCSNAIDITNYVALHMVVDYKLVNYGMDGVWFGLDSTHPLFLPDSTNYMFKSWDVADETSKEFTFDITSLSGLYYLQAAVIRDAVLRIRKVWLE